MAEENTTPVAAGTSVPAGVASDDISVDDVLRAMDLSGDDADPSGSDPDPEPATATDEVASSAPPSESAAPSREPDATVPPAETAVEATSDETPSGESPPGALPFERHKAILENARKEAESRGQQALLERMGISAQNAEQAGRLYQWLETNPQGFVQWLNSQVQPPQEEAAPAALEPALRSADGVAAWSAEQVQALLEQERASVLQQVETMLGPMKQHLQRVQQREFESRLTDGAKRQLAQARESWPMFTELEGDVKQRMAANAALSFEQAYIASFREVGLPKQEQTWKARQAEVMATKADAATDKPGTAPASPRDYRTMTAAEIAEVELEKAGLL